jgi:probable HAF family extracellular repeat protein
MPRGTLTGGQHHPRLSLSRSSLTTNGTFATGINAAGQVVGSYNDASNTAHSFIYAAAITVAARRTASMLPASISMFRSSNI